MADYIYLVQMEIPAELEAEATYRAIFGVSIFPHLATACRFS